MVGNADLNAQIAAGDPAAGGRRKSSSASTRQTARRPRPTSSTQPKSVKQVAAVGSASIPTFGSGTLGTCSPVQERRGDFHGASGFLLGQVDIAARNGVSNNRVGVTVRLIPNIGELALEAEEGTLLRRSQAALFNGLARRARAGNRAQHRHGPHTENRPLHPDPVELRRGRCCSQRRSSLNLSNT